MTRIYMFPGQGSQYKGMGAPQFKRFPELVRQAEAVLGYDLQALCLEDPRAELGQTAFTQPALYVVSVLCYLERLAQGQPEPDWLAGHSLGEWCALHVAGAFDFVTGLRIVQRRGELMGQARGGGMAAVLGLSAAEVQQLLAQQAATQLSIANHNSATQIILSGATGDLDAMEVPIEARGGRCVRLNVSAAFHSPGMASAREAFARFLADIPLAPLRIPVLSNCTALPHPRSGYRPWLEAQITSPVRWYETVSSLLQLPAPQFEEVGPGMVLSKLALEIRKQPLAGVSAPVPQSSADPQASSAPQAPMLPAAGGLARRVAGKAPVVMLFGGQGGQYRGMGRALYEHQPVFRAALEHCREQVHGLVGLDLVALLYDPPSAVHGPFDRTLHTHPAIFSVGYAAFKLLESLGVDAGLSVGYSLGEMLAGVAGGSLNLEAALRLVVEQAKLCELAAPQAASVVVMADHQLMHQAPDCFADAELSAINSPGCFVVVTEPSRVPALLAGLKSRGVLAQQLPISHGFHSARIDPIRDKFRLYAERVRPLRARRPWVSCGSCCKVDELTPQAMWQALRLPLDLPRAMCAVPGIEATHFIDLSPSGAMGNFLRRMGSGPLRVSALMSPFGQDLKLLEHLRQAH